MNSQFKFDYRDTRLDRVNLMIALDKIVYEIILVNTMCLRRTPSPFLWHHMVANLGLEYICQHKTLSCKLVGKLTCINLTRCTFCTSCKNPSSDCG